MQRYFYCAVATIVVGATLLSGSVTAGSRLDLQHRIAAADVVVLGRVCNLEARWETRSYGTIIVSRATLCVKETYKSNVAGPYVLDVDGGTLDGVTLQISDLPTLHVGDTAVFLLKRSDADVTVMELAGNGLGYFTFVNNAQVSDYYGVLTVPLSLIRNVSAEK